MFDLVPFLFGINILCSALCLVFFDKCPVLFSIFALHYLCDKLFGFDRRKSSGNIGYGRTDGR